MLKVWGSCALSILSWIHTLLCDGKQKMLPSPHSLHYWAFLSAWQWRYSFSQGENPSVDMYCTQSEHSWATVGDSVETSGAKLLIKDQSIQGGHPPGVKQVRCEQEGSRAKKGQSSIRKVLEDIRSTRRLDIFWIKPKAYSFLQSFNKMYLSYRKYCHIFCCFY